MLINTNIVMYIFKYAKVDTKIFLINKEINELYHKSFERYGININKLVFEMEMEIEIKTIDKVVNEIILIEPIIAPIEKHHKLYNLKNTVKHKLRLCNIVRENIDKRTLNGNIQKINYYLI